MRYNFSYLLNEVAELQNYSVCIILLLFQKIFRFFYTFFTFYFTSTNLCIQAPHSDNQSTCGVKVTAYILVHRSPPFLSYTFGISQTFPCKTVTISNTKHVLYEITELNLLNSCSYKRRHSPAALWSLVLVDLSNPGPPVALQAVP